MARHSVKVPGHQAVVAAQQQLRQLVDDANRHVTVQQDLAAEQQRHRRRAITAGQLIVVFRARLLDICPRQYPLVVVNVHQFITVLPASPPATAASFVLPAASQHHAGLQQL
uniref:(northern house mosquito) hypothetical protein n=1 Tax=Culex pipiens TaxID=7175 RepID=A0A8D8MQ59_CULPI